LVPLTDNPARLRPTRFRFRANSASVDADIATLGLDSSKSGRGVPLTKLEEPRTTRPTEPRDSYASGIRIPHSSPSAISNSRSDKVIPRTEQVFSFESSSAKAIFRAFSTESATGPHGRVKVRVSGKADRAEGLPRLWDTDTSLITFREKQLSLAQTSLLPTRKSRYSKQEEKRRNFTTRRGCVFWPRQPQKAHATRQSDPAGSGLDAGRGQQHPRQRRQLR
jgi:hypothetical protein